MKCFFNGLAGVLFLALLVSVASHTIFSNRPTVPPPVPVVPAEDEHRVFVVASEVNLMPGERVIEDGMVKRRKYPEPLLPHYASLDVKDVLGKIPVFPIYRFEPMVLQRLLDRDAFDRRYKAMPLAKDEMVVAVVVDGGRRLAPMLVRGQTCSLLARYDRVTDGASTPVPTVRAVAHSLRYISTFDGPDQGGDDAVLLFSATYRHERMIELVSRMGTVRFFVVVGPEGDPAPATPPSKLKAQPDDFGDAFVDFGDDQ